MKYQLETTGKFKKDLKTLIKRNYDIDLLQHVVDTLLDGIPLLEKHKDHALSGNWANYRECHITPDWLLIYKIEKMFSS